MERTNVFSGAGLNRSLASAFAERAGHAGKSEMAGGRFPACVKRNDVVDVKGGFLCFLREAAVLATVCGTPDALLPQLCGHGYRGMLRGLAVRASATVRGGQRVLQALRPRAARSPSALSPGPAYPTAHEAVSEGPWEIEVWPGRPGVPSRIERVFAYLPVSLWPKLTQRRLLSKPVHIGDL